MLRMTVRYKFSLLTLGLILPGILVADEPVTPPETREPTSVETPPTPSPEPEENTPPPKPKPKHLPLPHLQGSLEFLPEEERNLFTPGIDVGHVRDNPANPHRRLVQRTIMQTELIPAWGAVLTFDDQLIPFTPQESSGISVARDLQKANARGIFFANVPGVSSHDVRRIIRKNSSSEKRKLACQELLESKRAIFVEALREILRLKNTPPLPHQPTTENTQENFASPPPPIYYTCEVYNHTAFHQDMKTLKPGSDQLALCLQGISFIEECLDEAYEAERPGWKRTRWFRFPFLHAPKKKAVKKEVIACFNELGLLSLGETQDSKDVLNLNWKKAYESLQAAKKHRRYNPKFGGVYSQADQPIALFHTKTWRKVKKGILKAIPAS